MSREPFGSASASNAEWDKAWNVIRRLAVARGGVVPRDRDDATARTAVNGAAAPPFDAAAQLPDDLLFVSDDVERDLADIAQASASLRRAQPDLEDWTSQENETEQAGKPRSVWLIISAVWIATLLLTAMATLALATLID